MSVYSRDYISSLKTFHNVHEVTSTAPVKTKRANTLGLSDMSGNVAEFCFDWYALPNMAAQTYKVIRGGLWEPSRAEMSNRGETAFFTNRFEDPVSPKMLSPWNYNNGFRLAQSAFDQ